MGIFEPRGDIIDMETLEECAEHIPVLSEDRVISVESFSAIAATYLRMQEEK